jgi:hypothetical protein
MKVITQAKRRPAAATNLNANTETTGGDHA